MAEIPPLFNFTAIIKGRMCLSLVGSQLLPIRRSHLCFIIQLEPVCN